jgi:hypothetical protein
MFLVSGADHPTAGPIMIILCIRTVGASARFYIVKLCLVENACCRG